VNIPFLDLSRLHATIEDELISAFKEAVHASTLVGDQCCDKFERELARAHERVAAVACGSGTDALILALRAVGVQPGDEVVVPAMTFMATAEAVVRSEATPVLADVDQSSLLLTTDSVAAVLSSRTRAVVPVHLYGHVVPFDQLRTLRESGLEIVEDAAQAHLATWRDLNVGTVGAAACFSFYPGKNLGALGDGGAVVSDDTALLERVRRLRNHGSSIPSLHDEIGHGSRLDGIQANVLSAKLGHLRSWTQRRRECASRYRELFSDIPSDLASVVPWDDGAVHHLLVIRVLGGRRDAVRQHLESRGIQSRVHYPLALSQQPALAQWVRPCPNAESAASEVLSLPIDPLMTDAEVEMVCEAVHDAVVSLSRHRKVRG
jgi:dTDP-4-amino-4,6-dideoxygalactose transaminase